MQKKFLFILLLIISGLFLAGWSRIEPIYNVDRVPISNNSNLTGSDIEKAIIRAGVQLGWQMSKVQDGIIIGTLYLRKHMAQVEIKYSNLNYSINYKESSGLDFSPEYKGIVCIKTDQWQPPKDCKETYSGATIHRNYNGWIRNLEKAIKTQIELI
ncbi:MAG: hypothetical protein LBP54_04040 [Campylobacteraceae bacterium]|jgi:hypothetical protein|nr:hypothetical protein [Campylobacteraceae bacterium]